MTIEALEIGLAEIEPKALQLIEAEVKKDVASLKEEDPETAELLEVFTRDYKISEYLFLEWFDKFYHPSRILYPGSGFDVIPKCVFGEERVVHTSLEDIKDGVYFPQLGSGQKIIAENSFLPFSDQKFSAALIIGLAGIDQNQLGEVNRVLVSSGLVVIAQPNHELVHIAELDSYNMVAKFWLEAGFESLEVPDYLQKQGESQTEFLVFRKTR